jgi:UDP-N-acetylmuramyl pentapeptide phosphotransferase/UDP-N-acetylglucosamine-1-phosphate transferase
LRRLVLASAWLSLILITGWLVARLATPSYPQINFKTGDGVSGQILLGAQPSLLDCRQAASQIAQAFLVACPTCQVSYSRCVSELSDQQKIIEGRSTTEFAVCLENCVLMLAPTLAEPVHAPCQLFDQGGIGNCLGRPDKLVSSAKTAGPAKVPSLSELLAKGLIPFLASLFFGLLIILTAPLHHRWTADHPAAGVQKLHARVVSRVGGLALVFGALAPLGWLVVEADFQANLSKWLWQGQHSGTAVLQLLIIASLPAFVFGLLEDLTGRVGVFVRLFATLASAAVAWWLSGLSIQRLDAAPLDALLAIAPVSVVFTLFAVAGIANAMNIVDGLHGLASGIGALALGALGFIAWTVGDYVLASATFALLAATAGFFVLNYPWGRLFLGDGGAYLLGFWLAWVSVLLVARNPDVSPWACLLITVYPVTEVLYSILRRLAAKLHVGHPDRDHLHSLFKIKVVASRFPYLSLDWQNALATPGLWIFAAAPMVVAVFFYGQPIVLLSAALVFVGAYYLIYRHFREAQPSPEVESKLPLGKL